MLRIERVVKCRLRPNAPYFRIEFNFRDLSVDKFDKLLRGLRVCSEELDIKIGATPKEVATELRELADYLDRLHERSLKVNRSE